MTQLKHSLLTASLIPASVLLTATASLAAVPKGAFVTSMSGSSILLERPGRASESAAAWRTQLRDYRENLFVPKGTTSTATLTGISAAPGVPITPKHLIGPTAYVRSQTLDTRYRFPCTVSGEGLLGWRPSRDRDDRGCVPPGVRIRAGQSGGTAFVPLQAPIIATKQLLKAQGLPDVLLGLVRVQYCSAIGDGGTGWGVSSSDSMG
ncbi:MAG: hypothetical protein LH702_22670, partial [Phormidesmis sp. CAN_BIN44]|nr:hypothetical protein [Phormidesmis sp. CAN_BIN44]